MLTYQERVELAEHGIAFTWSENLNRKHYPKGFGFFPMTDDVINAQVLRCEYPIITQQEVDRLINEKFGYFVFDPALGEVDKKVQQILPDTECVINGEMVIIPQVAPVQAHACEMSICATHGIVDGKIYKIEERGNHSFTLSNGDSYWKDNTRGMQNVIWVRMIATNYDGIEYSTH